MRVSLFRARGSTKVLCAFLLWAIFDSLVVLANPPRDCRQDWERLQAGLLLPEELLSLFPTRGEPYLALQPTVSYHISEGRVAQGRPFPSALDAYLVREFEISLIQRPFAVGGEAVLFQGTRNGERVVVRVLRSDGNFRNRDPNAALLGALFLSQQLSLPLFVRSSIRLGPDEIPIMISPMVTRSDTGPGSSEPAPTLSDRLEAVFFGPDHPERTLRAISQLGRALRALSDAGIVHRDLSPNNILVRDDGSIRIVDFGLGTFENRYAAGFGQINQIANRAVGTMGMMSVNQSFGMAARQSDDIFAIQQLMWQMLSAERFTQMRNIFVAIVRPPDGSKSRTLIHTRYSADTVNPAAHPGLSVVTNSRLPETGREFADLINEATSFSSREFFERYGERVREFLRSGQGSRNDRVFRFAQELLTARALIRNSHLLGLSSSDWREMDEAVRQLQSRTSRDETQILNYPTRVHPNPYNLYRDYWRERRFGWALRPFR